jgi:hypothetical protein
MLIVTYYLFCCRLFGCELFCRLRRQRRLRRRRRCRLRSHEVGLVTNHVCLSSITSHNCFSSIFVRLLVVSSFTEPFTSAVESTIKVVVSKYNLFCH